MIGKGTSVRYALMEMIMVAEGYYSSNCINEINRELKVEIPIANGVYNILYKKTSPAAEIEKITEILK